MARLCLKAALFAASAPVLHGCMTSPADQLASVGAVPDKQHSATSSSLSSQTTNSISDQSAIASQAAEDASSLNAASYPALDAAPENSQQAASGDVMVGQKNISAANASIFSSAGTVNMPKQETSQQVALNAVEDGVQPGQTLNAAQNSIYSGTTAAAPRDTAAIPLPDADNVSAVQDLALAGMAIPEELNVASADPAAIAADPGLAQAARNMGEISDPADQKAALQADEQKPVRKSRTLADFFRGNRQGKSFNTDRFGNSRSRVAETSKIPNMRTAAITDNQLPGVNTNAMFPIGGIPDDDASEGGDRPEGLMQLASLSGMARVAPNGLWTQTDKVEVRCLRPQLVSLLRSVEDHYKRPVVVTSGFRDIGHNRRVGGVRHSLHTLCAAADIQVQGVSKWALADYIRSIPGRGGVGTYCHTDSVHVDIGTERDWNWRCRRNKSRRG